MPDTEPSISNEPAPGDTRNLPAVVPQPNEGARPLNDSWVSRMLRTLFNWKAGSIRADLEVVLEAGAPGETGFSPEESTMLKNILGLRERRVEDVMLPRADIVAVQQDITLGELVKVFEKAGHSRLVAYDDTLDDPIGMVHIRDLIAFMTAKAAVDPVLNAKRKKPLPAGLDLKAIDLAMPLSDTKIMRELLFVPPSMPAIDLLAKMQATRIHLALVIDEYGGTDGLISMEDIVELIVGDIADEHDLEEAPYIVRQPDGSYVADARTELEEVTETVGTEFDVGEAADDVDTLGGYLVMKAGRVPVRGELVPGPGTFEIEVLDADPRRVKRVRIYRSKDRKSARPRDARRRPADGDSPLAPAETAPPAEAAPPTEAPPHNEASADREPPASAPAAAPPKADPQP
jgi:CBS domain containing-hemolysin-like protein